MTASRSRFRIGQLARQQPALVHRFLPARRIGAHGLQRAGEPARVADVVGDEVEDALHEGAYKQRPRQGRRRQACRQGSSAAELWRRR